MDIMMVMLSMLELGELGFLNSIHPVEPRLEIFILRRRQVAQPIQSLLLQSVFALNKAAASASGKPRRGPSFQSLVEELSELRMTPRRLRQTGFWLKAASGSGPPLLGALSRLNSSQASFLPNRPLLFPTPALPLLSCLSRKKELLVSGLPLPPIFF